jgi:signal transduction histidine kinase
MFEFTEEYEPLLREVKEIALKVVKPRAKEIEESDQFPYDMASQFFNEGYLQILIPTHLGGMGKDIISLCIISEEMAVEDLLMLSKIESKEFNLKREVVSVEYLIHDVLDYIKEVARKKRISISEDEISPSLFIEADHNYLELVLINLLDNAIKYNHSGGGISISAIEKDQKEIQFSIKDNGIGIPKENLFRIFERFYRVDKGRSQEVGGTGLGLSIVKHIVQAHGGKVWAESRVGEGSTFYFTLPKISETI